MVFKVEADHVARDFNSFTKETQQLIKAVLGQKQESLDRHTWYLATNLRRSDASVEVAEKLVNNEPLIWHWTDCLNIMLLECLKPYHEESFNHLMRLKLILKELKMMLDNRGLKGIPDYGNKEFIELRDGGFSISNDEWQILEYAFWYHDLAKMAYPISFWGIKNFSPEDRQELEAHARLFYNLGEMFNVPEIVVALSVLHHYPNKQYPFNGAVSRLKHHLEDSHFCNLLNFLLHCDIYEGVSGYRGYQEKQRSHTETMKIVGRELKGVCQAFRPVLDATQELSGSRDCAICAA